MDLWRLHLGNGGGGRVYLNGLDRYTGIFVAGKSGTGKSSLILYWWEQDGHFRTSRVVIEPSGFLARECDALSQGRARYCSLARPLSLNPMKQPYHLYTVADIVAEALNQVIAIVTRNANADLTVKMRTILTREIIWCCENGYRSLVALRDRIASLRGDNETREGIIYRLSFLLDDPRMVQILCGDNPIEWGEFIRRGESLIFDGFGMSADKLVFAGSLITIGIKNYMRYQRPKQYHPIALWIDESHNFTTPQLAELGKEGRKFKISIALFSQDVVMFPEKLRHVLFNLGTTICYRVGFHTAQHLAKELLVSAHTLQTLEQYHFCYLTPTGRGIAKAPHPPIVFFQSPHPNGAIDIPVAAEPEPEYGPGVQQPLPLTTPTQPMPTSPTTAPTTASAPKHVAATARPPASSSTPTAQPTPTDDVPRPRWFKLIPYSHETTTSEEARADAQ